MQVFITGHTGFKGAWLSLWLKHLGHEVCGYSLTAADKSLFKVADLSTRIDKHIEGDIRNASLLGKSIENFQPDLVVHLAAQALVRESYRNPLYTYEVNVAGTLNLLNAISKNRSISRTIVVTSDKVYRQDTNLLKPHTEQDPLGGLDPYSNSKAMADLLSQSWFKAEGNGHGIIARAGNVIGGGDASFERLIPDLARGIDKESAVMIRNPSATRPWQHVLDCLDGYLRFASDHSSVDSGSAWNIGPERGASISVADVADVFRKACLNRVSWIPTTDNSLVESKTLELDSSKFNNVMRWSANYGWKQAVELTAEWYLRVNDGENPFFVTMDQIQNYENARRSFSTN
jgi:CDP-glucose 4,6-dehydratase